MRLTLPLPRRRANSSVKKRVAEEKKHLSEELVVASIARGAELMGEGKVEEANMSFGRAEARPESKASR